MRPRAGRAGIAYLAITCTIAFCVATILSGCGPTKQPAAPAKTPAASHTPTPQAIATAAPATKALFTISAKVRNASGATVSIQLIAHPPLASDDPAAKAPAAEFLEQCGTGGLGLPITQESMATNHGSLLQLDLTSNANGEEFVSPLNLFLGGASRTTIASGTGITAPPAVNGCNGLYSWARSGTAHAITEFEADDASERLTQWRYGLYGFAVLEGANATIEGCTITLSPQALNSGLKDVPGWVASDTSGTTCATGYIGE